MQDQSANAASVLGADAVAIVTITAGRFFGIEQVGDFIIEQLEFFGFWKREMMIAPDWIVWVFSSSTRIEPHRPEPIDIGMMQKEHRVERSHADGHQSDTIVDLIEADRAMNVSVRRCFQKARPLPARRI